MSFSVGDRVLFKTWDELKDEFGIDENGNIPCYFGFNPEMDEAIDRERTYVISNEDELGYHIDDIPEEYNISADMLKPAEGTEETPKTEVYSVDWMGSFEFLDKIKERKTNDISSTYSTIRYFYKNIFESLLMNSNYKIGAFLGDYTANPEYVQEAFTSIGLVFLREKTYTEEGIATFTNFWDENNAETLNIGGREVHKIGDVYYTFISGMRDLKEVDFIQGLIYHMCSTYELNPDQGILEAIINKDVVAWENRGKEIITEVIHQQRKQKILNNIPSIKEKLSEYKGEKLQVIVDQRKADYDRLATAMRNAYQCYLDALKDKMFSNFMDMDKKIEIFCSYILADVDNILDLKFSGENIYIKIMQPLIFFNEDDWELVKENTLQGYRYRYVYEAIFSREATLMFEQGIVLNLNGSFPKKWSEGNFTVGMPNPHIHTHNCFGENKHKVVKAVMDGDYDQAYMQIKSAIAGVNVSEAVTIDPFKDYFYDYRNIECITIEETGEVMSVEEANDYFKKKKGE